MTDDQLLQPDPDPHRRFLPGAVRLPARMGQRNGAPGAGWGVALAVGLLLAAFPLRARATAAGPQAPAPSREVAGRVVDSVTGAPVSGARVTVGGRSATTREDGSFELSVAATARSASAAAPGYFDNAVPLPDEGPVLIELLPRTFEEEAVEVTAEAPELERPAATRVAPDEVLETAGTVDNIFRALATLPGVTPTTDFGSFLSVRGGTPDQNLTLMDGVEIHNPYRLFGLVSAFNPETVSDFSLAAGGFGAQYGDRLSSLLVVRNRPGERAFGGTSSLSITDGNLVFEGPLPGGRLVACDRPAHLLRRDRRQGAGPGLPVVRGLPVAGGLGVRAGTPAVARRTLEPRGHGLQLHRGRGRGGRRAGGLPRGHRQRARRGPSRRAALGPGDRHHDPLVVPQHRSAGLRCGDLHGEPGGECGGS